MQKNHGVTLKSFSEWGQKQWSNRNKMEVEAVAVMLSWALYGAAMHWMQNQTTQAKDYINQLVQLMKNGIQLDNAMSI
ncbi:hypothetical protein AB4114_34775 [Paenibacillus sp. 2RAB27]|uniref:hypothetical protein n=1 Tax=Paenibacillus sp. 2RAB27 TaxID=3232991 RepID=UPI003F9997F6